MPHDYEERGARAWATRWWRALLAELVSTALLVALGLAAAVPVGAAAPQLTHIACAFGFVVAGNCVAFGAASGAHMNPAVTVAALVTGRLRSAPAAGYVAAQCLGAVVGFGALLAAMPVQWAPLRQPPLQETLGVTQPNEAAGVSALAALAIEAVLTGLLALACCAAWQAHDTERPDHAMPIKLGLLVAGLIYAGGPATGASLNPARSLAPALWHLQWKHQWVYWVGPLGGAGCAAALHRWVLTPPAAPAHAPRAPEELPLSDKP